MKSMCQLQLRIYYHLSFDAYPYPRVILVNYLEVNHKKSQDAIESHTNTVDRI